MIKTCHIVSFYLTLTYFIVKILKKGNCMAYKWKKGKVIRVSLPKKLSKKNKKLLEEYFENANIPNEIDLFQKLNIKTFYAN